MKTLQISIAILILAALLVSAASRHGWLKASVGFAIVAIAFGWGWFCRGWHEQQKRKE